MNWIKYLLFGPPINPSSLDREVQAMPRGKKLDRIARKLSQRHGGK